MSKHEFSDDCPGCRPAIMKLDGTVYPPGTPEMDIVDRVWATTTLMERMAFHQVSCLSSQSAVHESLVRPIMKKIEKELKNLKKESA